MTTKNGTKVTDASVCHYCLTELTVLTRTKDHVVPKSIGGMDIRSNIVWACRPC